MLQGFVLALLHFVRKAALSGGSGTCPIVSSQRQGGTQELLPVRLGGLKPCGHGGPAPPCSPKSQHRQGWDLVPTPRWWLLRAQTAPCLPCSLLVSFSPHIKPIPWQAPAA